MSEAPVTPTRDQLQAAYTKLAAEVGHLYFTLEGAKAHVAALEAQLTSAKEQRAALQKTYEAASETVPAATPATDPA